MLEVLAVSLAVGAFPEVGGEDFQQAVGLAREGYAVHAVLAAKLAGGDAPLCQIVASPLSGPEWSVYLVRADDGSPEIVAATFPRPMWEWAEHHPDERRQKMDGTTRILASLRGAHADVETARIAIPAAVGDAIEETWLAALRRARGGEAADLRRGHDQYYLFHPTAQPAWAHLAPGEVASGRVALLLGLVQAMRDYAQAPPNLRAGALQALSARAAVARRQSLPAPPPPLRAGRDVDEPRLIERVEPDPPKLGQARIQGTVVLECVVEADGRVGEVRVLRGIPVIDEAAVDAVRQWVYEPTLVDGAPVRVSVVVALTLRAF